MPMYEYKCFECDNKFEELVLNQSQTINCPECKSEKVEKQLSTFAASVSSGGSTPPCGDGGGGCSSGFS